MILYFSYHMVRGQSSDLVKMKIQLDSDKAMQILPKHQELNTYLTYTTAYISAMFLEEERVISS